MILFSWSLHFAYLGIWPTVNSDWEPYPEGSPEAVRAGTPLAGVPVFVSLPVCMDVCLYACMRISYQPLIPLEQVGTSSSSGAFAVIWTMWLRLLVWSTIHQMNVAVCAQHLPPKILQLKWGAQTSAREPIGWRCFSAMGNGSCCTLIHITSSSLSTFQLLIWTQMNCTWCIWAPQCIFWEVFFGSCVFPCCLESPPRTWKLCGLYSRIH